MRISTLGLLAILALGSAPSALAQGYYPPDMGYGTSLQWGPGGMDYHSSAPADPAQPYASPVWGGQPAYGHAPHYRVNPGLDAHDEYRQDKRLAHGAQQTALRLPTGGVASWSNPANANHGMVWPTGAPMPGHGAGQTCRLLEERLWINGRQHQNRGVACTQPPGHEREY